MHRRQSWAMTCTIAYLRRLNGPRKHPNKAARIYRRYEGQIFDIKTKAKDAEVLALFVER